MVTTTLEGEEAVASAKSVIEQHPQDRAIIDLASTIILYKFANLSRAEVEAMLAIELQQTRVYHSMFKFLSYGSTIERGSRF
jgi:predicted transposase YdaD